jgi:RNA polymerase sigma-70 factor (ECF subfamily)
VPGESFPHILQAARAGSEWAWTSIYRDLAPPVLGYLRARGAGEPEDLTGEVFLQVVRDLGGFDGGEREFRAWVFAIAHNRLVDERRRNARRPVEPTPDVPTGEYPTPDAEEEALEEVAAERVHRILKQLAPDQGAVLLLRVLGQLTVEEVARVLGKSPGAVKALQRRGLRAVERALVKEGVPL